MDSQATPRPPSEREQLEQLPFVPTSEDRPHDFGMLLDGTFYHWNVRLDKTSRRLRVWTRRVNQVVTFLVVLLAFVCFALFAVSTFVLEAPTTWQQWVYWQQPSLAQLWLWLGCAGVLYWIYRRAHAVREPKEEGDRQVHEPKLVNTTWEAVQAAKQTPRIAMPKQCVQSTWEALDQAASLAEAFHHPYVSLLHLFAGTLTQPSVGHVFARLGLSFEAVKGPLSQKLHTLAPVQPGQSEASGFDPLGQRTLLGAMVHAYRQGRTTVTPVDVFVSAFENSPFLTEVFYGAGVEEEALQNVLVWLRIREDLRARWHAYRKASFLKPKGNMNRAMTAIATPMLDSMSQDLTRAAAYGGLPMLIGRDEELARVLRIFEGGGRSAILVGPPGVGKQALIEGIAERMVQEAVPEMLQDRRLVRIDVGRLVAGATPAQAQERLLRALSEVARSRNIALAIENIDDLVGISAGGAQSLDLSALLAGELEKGYVVLIATTTPEAYRTSIEGTALGSVLTKVLIEEPSRSQAIQILEAKVNAPEVQQGVLFSYEAVEACVDLTSRFLHDAYLPEKAIRILDEVALLVKQQRGTGATVRAQDVAAVVSSASSVPLTAITQDEKDVLLHLEERMHGRVIGQDEAVKMVASALRRARTELRSGRRPIANFLFLGPTGVGKTELAKTIAQTYFGNEDAMIRLDMSEYQNPDSLSRLLGVPGSGQGGLFTEAVRKRPFGLILLDELEKAHPDILNVFLQVFDDGRLTDAAGRVVDFTQSILVATSNAGSGYIQQAVKAGTDATTMKTHLLETELAQVYRPEFLNRFDGVVIFTPLTLEHVTQIAQLMLGSLRRRLDEKGMGLEVTDAALKELAVAGYDPQFGARPLRRVVQERVEDPIATLLLEEKAQRRDTIVLDAGGAVTVKKAAAL